MTDKVEGTLIIKGMAEGRIPDRPDVEKRMKEWVKFAESLGLRFHLELEGGSFSLLADAAPIQLGDIEADLTTRTADALREFLKVFTPDERRAVFSTIRSSEYKKDSETQTLFNIGPDGDIQVRQRTVEAETAAPPRQLTLKEKLRYGIVGLGVALLIFAISAFFVDYGALFNQAVEQIKPFRPGELRVDPGPFRSFFTVEKIAATSDGRAMLLTLRRTDRFPRSESAIESLASESQDSVTSRLRAEALARGYVRFEMFDARGEFLGHTMQRISGLSSDTTATLVLPLPQRHPARMRITY
jgi:hypothetical protein